jgi:hypothetical protein
MLLFVSIYVAAHHAKFGTLDWRDLEVIERLAIRWRIALKILLRDF